MSYYQEPTPKSTLVIIIVGLFLIAVFISWFASEAARGGM